MAVRMPSFLACDEMLAQRSIDSAMLAF